MRILVVLMAVLPCTYACSQQRMSYTRNFHFSVVPGFGTNGMHPGGYTNVFAIHATSGYSAANLLFEVAGISNLNINNTRGIQFASIANFTGANAYESLQEKDRNKMIREGFEANLSGAQFSGITNVVLNNVFGWQTTGGMNIAKGALMGLQLAGVSNVVYKYSFGVQLAGVSNVSYQSMDGVQVALFANYTSGGLYGVQIAAFNKADFMEGKNSFGNADPTGVQIGFVNVAKRMNGFQIGLVNKARRSQGTQVGLINLYRQGKTTGTKDGTAIGLLNFGGSGYGAVYTNELFYTNVEIATGNSKNSRLESDSRTIYIQNSLIYSNDAGVIDGKRKKWAIGYGLKKFYFNRSGLPGMSHFRFVAFGMDFLHLNHEEKKFTKSLSLVTRPTIAIGTRLHPRLHSIYLFGAVTYNAYWTNTNQKVAPSFLEASTTVGNQAVQLWPGFSAGVLIR